MAKKKQNTLAVRYIRRLAQDEYAKEELRHAASRVGEVYARIAKKRGRAVEDKKLYSNLREAAISIRNTITTLGRPKPEPKRRGRKLIAIALPGGAAALPLWSRLGRQKDRG